MRVRPADGWATNEWPAHEAAASPPGDRPPIHAHRAHPRRRLWLAAAATVVLAVGALGAVVWISGRPEPTAWTSRAVPAVTGTTAARPSTSDAAAPPPAASQSPARAATSTLRCKARPSACGFPDATNTGVPAGAKMQALTSNVTITKPGVYSGLNISGSLTVKASHVTVRNSRIRCGGGDCVALLGTYDTLMDSEVGGGASGHDYTRADYNVYSGGTTNTNLVLRVNMHDADDGMRVDGGTTVQDSWIHDQTSGVNGSHSDGVQSCQGTGMAFLHNTIWGGNNDPLYFQGGDCSTDDSKPSTDITVNNNLLLCLAKPDNTSSYGIGMVRTLRVSITNNHFDRGWQVVPVGTYRDNSLFAFSGNVYDNDGKPIPNP